MFEKTAIRRYSKAALFALILSFAAFGATGLAHGQLKGPAADELIGALKEGSQPQPAFDGAFVSFMEEAGILVQSVRTIGSDADATYLAGLGEEATVCLIVALKNSSVSSATCQPAWILAKEGIGLSSDDGPRGVQTSILMVPDGTAPAAGARDVVFTSPNIVRRDLSSSKSSSVITPDGTEIQILRPNER